MAIDPIEIIVTTNAAEAAGQFDTLAGSLDKAAGAADRMAGSVEAASGAADTLAGSADVATAASDRLAAANLGAADSAATSRYAHATLATKIGQSGAAADAAAAQHEALGTKIGSSVPYIAAQGAAFDRSAASASSWGTAVENGAARAGRMFKSLAIGDIIGGWFSIKSFSNWEYGINRLATSAGELRRNLGMDNSLLLQSSVSNATSQSDTLAAAYYANSAGFHGMSGINIVRAGQQMGWVGNTTAQSSVNALTSILDSYGMKGTKGQINSTGNEIIATEAHGKMTMDDLNPVLATIVPLAGSMGIPLPQVLGMLATMTQMGQSPARAATYIRQSLRTMSNPTTKMVSEWGQLGLDQTQVMNMVKQQGLPQTFQYISSAVAQHLGKNGDVVFSAYKQSKSASQDLAAMMAAASPDARAAMQEYASGQLTYSQFRKNYIGTGANYTQAMQFKALFDKANGFNDLIKSGGPAVQTFMAALNTATGNISSAQTLMETTGSHYAMTLSNIAAIQAAGKNTKDITGMDSVRKTAKFGLKQAELAAQSAMTSFGKTLWGLVRGPLKWFSNLIGSLAKHPAIMEGLGIGAVGLTAGAGGFWAFAKGFKAYHWLKDVKAAKEAGGWGGMFKRVFGIGKDVENDVFGGGSTSGGSAATMMRAAELMMAAAEKMNNGLGSGLGGGLEKDAEKTLENDAEKGFFGKMKDALNPKNIIKGLLGKAKNIFGKGKGLFSKIGNLFKGGSGDALAGDAATGVEEAAVVGGGEAAAEGGVMAAGAALGPETLGVSLAIAGATAAYIKWHKQIDHFVGQTAKHVWHGIKDVAKWGASTASAIAHKTADVAKGLWHLGGHVLGALGSAANNLVNGGLHMVGNITHGIGSAIGGFFGGLFGGGGSSNSSNNISLNTRDMTPWLIKISHHTYDMANLLKQAETHGGLALTGLPSKPVASVSTMGTGNIIINQLTINGVQDLESFYQELSKVASRRSQVNGGSGRELRR
jgi:TP901 family phage tail tape measure protein